MFTPNASVCEPQQTTEPSSVRTQECLEPIEITELLVSVFTILFLKNRTSSLETLVATIPTLFTSLILIDGPAKAPRGVDGPAISEILHEEKLFILSVDNACINVPLELT